LSDVLIYLLNIFISYYTPGDCLLPQPEDAPPYGDRNPRTVNIITNHRYKHMKNNENLWPITVRTQHILSFYN